MVTETLSKHQGNAHIYYFRSSQPVFGLLESNRLTGETKGIYNDRLKAMYPDTYGYHIYTNEYFDFQGTLTLSAIRSKYHKSLVYIGSNPDNFEKINGDQIRLDPTKPPFDQRAGLIHKGKSEVIYVAND